MQPLHEYICAVYQKDFVSVAVSTFQQATYLSIPLTCLSLHQSVCDVPPSCFTGSDDLYYLEKS